MSDWHYDAPQVDGAKQLQAAVRAWAAEGFEIVQIVERREAQDSFIVLVRRPAT
jgi:hypothetical protein